MQRLGATPTAPSGALYPPKVDGDDEVITAFMPIAAPIVLDDQALADGVANQLLASTTCAVLTHRGAYSTMGETYRQIGAWVVTNAVPADQSVRELYVVSTDETTGTLLPDDELRTEIAWPIEPDAVSQDVVDHLHQQGASDVTHLRSCHLRLRRRTRRRPVLVGGAGPADRHHPDATVGILRLDRHW